MELPEQRFDRLGAVDRKRRGDQIFRLPHRVVDHRPVDMPQIESRRIPRVFTMDSDFRVYRTKGGGWIEMVP